MTRRITYASQLAISLFALQDQKEAMIELAKGLSAILGPTTEIDGFNCTQSTPPALTVDVAGGTIFENQDIDLTPFGTLPSQIPADTDHQILKLAYNLDTTQFSFTPPGTVGFSRADLIQMRLEEKDGASTSIPFYNGTGNPPVFMTKDVLRIDSVIMNVKAGTPATSGTEVPPAPDSGYIGVWVVTTTNGQTTILNADIEPYPNAPFITEKLKDKISQATADARYARPANIQSGQYVFADASGTNTYTASLTPSLTGLTNGMVVNIGFVNVNTITNPTLNINGLGAITIINKGNLPLAIGQLRGVVALYYDQAFNKFVPLSDSSQGVALVGSVRMSAGQSVPIGNTKIDFDTVESDPHSLWNAANTRWVVSTPGWYELSVTLFGRPDNLAATSSLCYLYKNGSPIKRLSEIPNAYDFTLSGSYKVLAAANDYFEIYGSSGDPSGNTTFGDDGGATPVTMLSSFQIEFIGS